MVMVLVAVAADVAAPTAAVALEVAVVNFQRNSAVG